MKKFGSFLKTVIVVLVAFILQILISNNLQIFGIVPNVILVTITIISMWNNTKTNVMVAAILGIMSDMVFHYDFGSATISYIFVALLISYVSKKYRKNSKTAIVYITITSTLVFSCFHLICYIIENAMFVNVFAFLRQIIVEVLLNISLAYIIYKLFERHMKDRSLTNVFN